MAKIFKRINENIFKLVEDDTMEESKEKKSTPPICRHCKQNLHYDGQIACHHCGKTQGQVKSGEESHAKRFATKEND